ncbi:putative integral membrane protein [Rhodococcus sp. AW25M09]|uniref:alpha/beta-hydrolase family protein n=1 Tax=Rhodococcus sp. AW25M09 TaxID=1268303 RepID=UPI0002AC56C7|nr:alpha/beta-hydrolase family protein [Rhodococcus sp. AW25M09]CCQ16965.1 putative integral membrane protein [Rhodococcus sp. AW25M09]
MIASITGISGHAGSAQTDTAPSVSSIRLPRIETSAALTSAVLVSSAPALLPRPAVTQALLTGISMAIALAIAWSARRAIGTRRPARIRYQAWAAAVGALIFVGAVYSNILWQNRLRVAMEADTVHWRYAADVVCGAVCVALALCGLGLAVARMCRVLGGTRSVILIAIVGVLSYYVAAPALWSAMTDSFSVSNSALDDTVTAPITTTRSGGPSSLVPWHTLGREGRKFVSGGLDPATVRIYVGLDSAAALDRRVELAVADMERAGAFERSVVVVAIPTGSGWVDENAVTGAENRFGGDVATVALQYSDKPSWATFLFAEDDARRAADALVRAVATRAAEKSTQPSVIVYGQSLGSVAGSAAYLSLRQTHSRICGAVWAGPPAGAVNTESSTVLSNSSDPVAAWSAELLWSAPNPATTRRDAPTPMWLPIVSFVQTSVDLAAALDVGAGHGHRYGTDQGTAMPRCR